MEEASNLPVGVIHGHVDAFLQRAVLLFVGHACRKVERIVVGTRHERGEEWLAFLGERVAHEFDGVVHEGGIVFALAAVMLRGVPLGHPYAQVIPGGVRCRHVVRAVAVFGQHLHEARDILVRKVGRLREPRMVGDADMRREHAACGGDAARVHAGPCVGIGRQRVHEGRGRGLLRVQESCVQSALRFHEDKDEVGLHLALRLQFFALQKRLCRYAVERNTVPFFRVREFPEGISFDFLPQVLVGRLVGAEFLGADAAGILLDEQVPIDKRYDGAEFCHARTAGPDKINEQVRGDVEDEHRDDGLFHVEAVARAVPPAKQPVEPVGKREYEH